MSLRLHDGITVIPGQSEGNSPVAQTRFPQGRCIRHCVFIADPAEREKQANLAYQLLAHVFLPPWAHEGGPEALLARLSKPSTRRRIVAEMENGPTLNGAFTSLPSAANSRFAGQSFTAVARQTGLDMSGALGLSSVNAWKTWAPRRSVFIV
jgi:hypothetical protein